MPRQQEFTTQSAEETIALGRKLAGEIKVPKIVVLRGELGAGKTSLVKGIVEGFSAGISEQVNSPTFTLVHEYRSAAIEIYHIDLYRVDKPRELETLGIDDLISSKSLLLIEWGEKFERFQRERDLEIAIESRGENERHITVSFS
jgi:tRNA threonylcarbamoyladenosine biosynthesis protein TsaE